MPLVPFNDLTDAQKAEVKAVYDAEKHPQYKGFKWERYQFLVRKDGQMAKARGRHELTEEGYAAYKRELFDEHPNMLKNEDIRPEKGDLAGFRTTKFHLSHE